MTVLRDIEIRKLVQTAKVIEPFRESHLRGASYDLTAGWILVKDRPRGLLGGLGLQSELKVIGPESKEVGLTVAPGQVLTILTAETVKLPPNVIGTAFPINRLSEDGMLVLNPGHVDPGYEGLLSIRMVNLRQSQTYLALGDKVFTLILEQLQGDVASPYPGDAKHVPEERLRNMRNKVANSMSPSMLDVSGHLLAGELEDRFIRKDRLLLELALLLLKAAAVVGTLLGIVYSVIKLREQFNI